MTTKASEALDIDSALLHPSCKSLGSHNQVPRQRSLYQLENSVSPSQASKIAKSYLLPNFQIGNEELQDSGFSHTKNSESRRRRLSAIAIENEANVSCLDGIPDSEKIIDKDRIPICRLATPRITNVTNITSSPTDRSFQRSDSVQSLSSNLAGSLDGMFSDESWFCFQPKTYTESESSTPSSTEEAFERTGLMLRAPWSEIQSLKPRTGWQSSPFPLWHHSELMCLSNTDYSLSSGSESFLSESSPKVRLQSNTDFDSLERRIFESSDFGFSSRITSVAVKDKDSSRNQKPKNKSISSLHRDSVGLPNTAEHIAKFTTGVMLRKSNVIHCCGTEIASSDLAEYQLPSASSQKAAEYRSLRYPARVSNAKIPPDCLGTRNNCASKKISVPDHFKLPLRRFSSDNVTFNVPSKLATDISQSSTFCCDSPSHSQDWTPSTSCSALFYDSRQALDSDCFTCKSDRPESSEKHLSLIFETQDDSHKEFREECLRMSEQTNICIQNPLRSCSEMAVLPIVEEDVKLALGKKMHSTVEKSMWPIGEEHIQSMLKEDVQSAVRENMHSTLEEDMHCTLEENTHPTVGEDMQPIVEGNMQPTLGEDIHPTLEDQEMSLSARSFLNAKNQNIEEIGYFHVATDPFDRHLHASEVPSNGNCGFGISSDQKLQPSSKGLSLSNDEALDVSNIEDMHSTLEEHVQSTVKESMYPLLKENIYPLVEENMHPVVDEGMHPIVGEGMHPIVGEGMHPIVGEGMHPIVGEGMHPIVGEGMHPIVGEGMHPIVGEGMHPIVGEGMHPIVGEGMHPIVGEGMHPIVGEGIHPKVEKDVKPGLGKIMHSTVEKSMRSTVEENMQSVVEQQEIPPLARSFLNAKSQNIVEAGVLPNNSYERRSEDSSDVKNVFGAEKTDPTICAQRSDGVNTPLNSVYHQFDCNSSSNYSHFLSYHITGEDDSYINKIDKQSQSLLITQSEILTHNESNKFYQRISSSVCSKCKSSTCDNSSCQISQCTNICAQCLQLHCSNYFLIPKLSETSRLSSKDKHNSNVVSAHTSGISPQQKHEVVEQSYHGVSRGNFMENGGDAGSTSLTVRETEHVQSCLEERLTKSFQKATELMSNTQINAFSEKQQLAMVDCSTLMHRNGKTSILSPTSRRLQDPLQQRLEYNANEHQSCLRLKPNEQLASSKELERTRHIKSATRPKSHHNSPLFTLIDSSIAKKEIENTSRVTVKIKKCKKCRGEKELRNNENKSRILVSQESRNLCGRPGVSTPIGESYNGCITRVFNTFYDTNSEQRLIQMDHHIENELNAGRIEIRKKDTNRNSGILPFISRSPHLLGHLNNQTLPSSPSSVVLLADMLESTLRFHKVSSNNTIAAPKTGSYQLFDELVITNGATQLTPLEMTGSLLQCREKSHDLDDCTSDVHGIHTICPLAPPTSIVTQFFPQSDAASPTAYTVQPETHQRKTATSPVQACWRESAIRAQRVSNTCKQQYCRASTMHKLILTPTIPLSTRVISSSTSCNCPILCGAGAEKHNRVVKYFNKCPSPLCKVTVKPICHISDALDGARDHTVESRKKRCYRYIRKREPSSSSYREVINDKWSKRSPNCHYKKKGTMPLPQECLSRLYSPLLRCTCNDFASFSETMPYFESTTLFEDPKLRQHSTFRPGLVSETHGLTTFFTSNEPCCRHFEALRKAICGVFL